MKLHSPNSRSIPRDEFFALRCSVLLTLGCLGACASLYGAWLLFVTAISLTWVYVQVRIMVHEGSTQAVRPI